MPAVPISLLLHRRDMTDHMQNMQTFDLNLFLALHRSQYTARLTPVARSLSATGDGWLYLLIMPLSILLLQPQDSRSLILAALTGFAVERSIYFVLKNTLRRRRPHEAIENYRARIVASDRFSLPSGHTSAAFFVATFLSLGLSLIFLPLYLWALAVGMSRVVLGVHFPGDVLVGACLGITVGLVIL